MSIFKYILILCLIIISKHGLSQCSPSAPLRLYNDAFVATQTPIWQNCIVFLSDPDTYQLSLGSPQNIANYKVDYGDGTIETGTSLPQNTFINHTYLNLGTYTIKFTAYNFLGCDSTTVTGTLHNNRPPSAGILPPQSGINPGCAPHQVCFINSTPNASATTTFRWLYGDGTAENYDYTNAGDSVCHIYQRGSSSCNMTVTLIAQNTCGTSTATWNPVDIFDIDDAIIDPANSLLCYPDTTVTFTNNSIRNCFSGQRFYYWDFGDGTIVNWTSIDIPRTHHFPGIGTYTVMLIDSSYCGSDVTYATVRIVPPPVAIFTPNHDTICEDHAIVFTNTSTGAATRYRWHFGDGGTWVSVNNKNSQTHNYTNPGSYTVKLIADIENSSNACVDTMIKTIVVLPGPTANFNVLKYSCTPYQASILNTSIGEISALWNFNDGNTSPSMNDTITHTWVNATTNPKIFVLGLTVTSVNGCTSTKTANITVYPDVISDFIIDSVGCHPFKPTFTNTSVHADSISNWTLGDGSTSNATNPTHIYQNLNLVKDTLFSIQLIAMSKYGCTDTSDNTIRVKPKPIAAFTQDFNTACDSLRVTFINTSTAANKWNWDFKNNQTATIQTPAQQLYNNAGIFIPQLIVSNAFNCSDTTLGKVTIHPSPLTDFIANPVCLGQTANFTNKTSITNDTITNYNWEFGNGFTSTQDNPTTTYNTAGEIKVKLTAATKYCSTTDSLSLTVEALPIPAFTSDLIHGCTPLLINFTNESTNTNAYTWIFSDGTTSTNPIPAHTFTNNTLIDKEYTIKLIASSLFGCRDSITKTITVHPLPTAAFTHNALPGCSPLDVTFTNQSSNATKYYWLFNDSSAIDSTTNPKHLFVNSTSTVAYFEPRLIALTPNNCSDTASKYITVYPRPDFLVDVTPDTACQPADIILLATPGATTYRWIFGDGSSTTGNYLATHTYINSSLKDTTYTITMIATTPFNCLDTTESHVFIKPKPTALFSVDTLIGCTPFMINPINESSGANQYIWRFGDGNNLTTAKKDTVLNHVYYNSSSLPTSHTIELVAQNASGCRDSIQRILTVNPEVFASYKVDTVGCSPLDVVFKNQSYSATAYYWEFGDGETSLASNPQHIYTNIGIIDSVFNSRLIAISAYSCKDTFETEITVYPSPVANFTVTPSVMTYPDTTVQIINRSSDGNWNYAWDLGDNTTSTSNDTINHAYKTWNNYTIKLIVSGQHCIDSIARKVTLIPPIPIPDYELSIAEGCEPLTVEFTNLSKYAKHFYWEFGDGGYSTLENPIYTYTYHDAGTYPVELKAIGDGGDSATIKVIVTVYKKPTASFSIEPDSVYLPTQPIHCFNLSKDAKQYLWDFGDGSTSAEFNPIYQYKQEGNYNITLTTWGEHNCIDSLTIPNVVSVLVGGKIIFANAFTPNISGPNGGVYEKGEYNNDVFFPVHEGIENYHFMVFNRWGELIFETFDVNIGWDGYYRGELCKQDVYVWKVTGTFADGNKFTKAGDVTILK